MTDVHARNQMVSWMNHNGIQCVVRDARFRSGLCYQRMVVDWSRARVGALLGLLTPLPTPLPLPVRKEIKLLNKKMNLNSNPIQLSIPSLSSHDHGSDTKRTITFSQAPLHDSSSSSSSRSNKRQRVDDLDVNSHMNNNNNDDRKQVEGNDASLSALFESQSSGATAPLPPRSPRHNRPPPPNCGDPDCDYHNHVNPRDPNGDLSASRRSRSRSFSPPSSSSGYVGSSTTRGGIGRGGRGRSDNNRSRNGTSRRPSNDDEENAFTLKSDHFRAAHAAPPSPVPRRSDARSRGGGRGRGGGGGGGRGRGRGRGRRSRTPSPPSTAYDEAYQYLS
jgi:hypothetical protein